MKKGNPKKDILAIFNSINSNIEKCKENEPYIKSKWNKYKGDVCVRIFKYFLEQYLNFEYKISEPYGYIQGFSTEFDLLIVDKNAKTTQEYNNEYNPKDVKFGIEIKARGTYGGKKILQGALDKIKGGFAEVNKFFNHIGFIYFTFEEVTEPIRATSINYLKETINRLEPYKVFCLRDSRKNNLIREGEWQNLINYVNRNLGVNEKCN